jgi:WD40 repeat protein
VSAPSAILEPRASVVLDDYVAACEWSPDARQLAVAGGEGKIFLIGAAGAPQHSALEVATLGEHALGALGLSWQPRGALFATSGQDGSVRLWDAGSAELRRSWRPAPMATEHVAFSPDGRRLATSAGKRLFLWNDAGEPLHEFPPRTAVINSIAWDAAGRDLAAALNGGVVVHRVETAAAEARLFKWQEVCLTSAFSPNGKVLASGTHEGTVHFWYLASAKDSQMRGYPGSVRQTVWSANSRYLATAAAGDVVCWDFSGKGPEGSRPLQLTGHTDRVECLAFQPGGPYLVSGGRDWRLSLWQPGKSSGALDAHFCDAEVSALRWSPDGRRLAVGERRGNLTVYELKVLGR